MKTPEERWESPQDDRHPVLSEVKESAILCTSLESSVAGEKLLDQICNPCANAPGNIGFRVLLISSRTLIN